MPTTHKDFLDRARADAIRWARGLLAVPDDLVILDLETTGLGKTAQICQIGIIDGAGEVLVSTLVKPTIPIEPGASAVTGITDETVKDAPPFGTAAPVVHAALRNRHVVIYNRTFDWPRLRYVFGLYADQIAFPHTLSVSCAMRQYACFHGAWSIRHRSFTWQKLVAACEQMDVPVQGAHDATADCRMTLAVMHAMAAAPLPESEQVSL